MFKNEISMEQLILIGTVILISYFAYWVIISTKCRGSPHQRTRRTELITVDNEMSQRQHDNETNITINDTHSELQTPPPTYTKTILDMGLPPPYTSESDSINHRAVIINGYSSSIGEGTSQLATSSRIQTPPLSYHQI
ncbi:6248_t:CDS:2 [Dentiscutata erythropus]|uniref:6248_t:CDS:1 n=1 Tax=Dentiscutata erythropus TaxID=1348616 RepID=A0A9N9IZ87_9GLOM|nr:6248_t:CDS:2 [Dentiscutata erythropus]